MVIALKRSAVDKLVGDPRLRDWPDEAAERRRPCLRYFRRSYSTAKDGTVTDHGDGFSLSTIDPSDDMETKGLVLTSVPVVGGLDILVGSDAAMMAGSFLIGWSRWKFTYEPLA